LDVHELEGLLHVEDVRRTMLDELRAMSEERAEDAHLIVRSEGAGQQAKGMKSLQPLGVVVIGFAAGHDLEVARIDQVDADRGCLQHLVDGDPVDASRFHRDGVDVVVEQPGHQLLQIGREGGEGADDGDVTVGR
jgi:hypothetical protein